jgi:anaerobic selenocysteine-containing dehydrogenase
MPGGTVLHPLSYGAADRVIITWAMGLTQHKKAVDTVQEIMNVLLLLLRGNIGRRGAAISYPSARGCAATYFPEANVLIPLSATALGPNTPVS